MMYHDLDLANIQKEDNAEKNSSNRNNNAGKAQLEPSSVVEEITYPRVSHGKPSFQILFCNTQFMFFVHPSLKSRPRRTCIQLPAVCFGFSRGQSVPLSFRHFQLLKHLLALKDHRRLVLGPYHEI